MLKGKTALVTGSTSGIGLGIAKALAAQGANIVLNGFGDVEGPKAEVAALGVQVSYHGADMSKPAEIEDMINHATKTFGTLDILVNNAGIQFRKPMVELDTADWRRVIDINLTAAFILGRETARRMLARKAAGGCNPAFSTGKIVNIGSLMSGLGRATVAPYAAAKGGIKLLTQSMTAEWAEHNIQANAIGPGYMLTEMNQPLIDNPTFNSWVVGRTPARRWGQPEELVGAAVFLASNASNYVSGQILYVDGGMSSVL